MKKLFIITIEDMNGYQYPQGVHAAVDFVMKSKKAKKWYKNSNTVVCLTINRQEFEFFKNKISEYTKVYIFKEPDLQNAETSFCFLGNKKTKEITKILKLALKK